MPRRNSISLCYHAMTVSPLVEYCDSKPSNTNAPWLKKLLTGSIDGGLGMWSYDA